MSKQLEDTFSSVESAHEFVVLLATSVAQAKCEIEADLAREQNWRSSRRLDALRLTLYTVEKLELHVKRSRCALNDLRSLRRLLFDERATSQLISGSPLTGDANHSSHREPAKGLAQYGVPVSRQKRTAPKLRHHQDIVERNQYL